MMLLGILVEYWNTVKLLLGILFGYCQKSYPIKMLLDILVRYLEHC